MFHKRSSVINLIYSGQQLFSYKWHFAFLWPIFITTHIYQIIVLSMFPMVSLNHDRLGPNLQIFGFFINFQSFSNLLNILLDKLFHGFIQ
jgi:hypothetical protein